MIILDTNVVSEAMKPQPDTKVLAWLDSHPAETLYLTSITVAELLFGLAVCRQDTEDKDRRRRVVNPDINGCSIDNNSAMRLCMSTRLCADPRLALSGA